MAMFWQGSAPTSCDNCSAEITDEFSDMKTVYGPWGNLCPSCAKHGPGTGRYGTGVGQRYQKQEDGRWKKVEG